MNTVGAKYEIIVVDDASTDATGAIATEEGARVTRVAYRQISATRNAGAKVARGEILFFVDADTIVNARVVQDGSRHHRPRGRRWRRRPALRRTSPALVPRDVSPHGVRHAAGASTNRGRLFVLHTASLRRHRRLQRAALCGGRRCVGEGSQTRWSLRCARRTGCHLRTQFAHAIISEHRAGVSPPGASRGRRIPRSPWFGLMVSPLAGEKLSLIVQNTDRALMWSPTDFLR